MELNRLHELKLDTIHGDDAMTYLLDCQTFLMMDDLAGWKRKYQVDASPCVVPPPKRRRMSPNAVPGNEFVWDDCVQCKSNEIVNDVDEGRVVCTRCGLIQSMSGLGMGPAHMSVSRLRDGYRHVVHRYSRVVYFRSILNSIQGLTNPILPAEDESAMRRIIDGQNLTRVRPQHVKACLKQLKKSTRYRRHIQSLTFLLSGGVYKPVVIQSVVMLELLRLFRRIEVFWDHGEKQKNKKRRVFPSYQYIYWQLCHKLKLRFLTSDDFLLKNRRLMSITHDMYTRVATAAGINVMPFIREMI